jgi:hypothetical protein
MDEGTTDTMRWFRAPNLLGRYVEVWGVDPADPACLRHICACRTPAQAKAMVLEHNRGLGAALVAPAWEAGYGSRE